MNVNATPVWVTLVRVSGNPDQRTRIRAGTRTHVCVYVPLVLVFLTVVLSLSLLCCDVSDLNSLTEYISDGQCLGSSDDIISVAKLPTLESQSDWDPDYWIVCRMFRSHSSQTTGLCIFGQFSGSINSVT